MDEDLKGFTVFLAVLFLMFAFGLGLSQYYEYKTQQQAMEKGYEQVITENGEKLWKRIPNE